jgi:hypothetical protein
MMNDKTCRDQVHLFWVSGLIFFAICVGLLLVCLLMPPGIELNPAGQDRSIGNIAMSTLDRDRFSLLERRATERLIIKAAQAQAAVKDSGLAAELAKNLRLQGIANMPAGLTAYIRDTKEKRTLTVREGDKAAEFIVRTVEQDSVILDLDGVEVRLSY